MWGGEGGEVDPKVSLKVGLKVVLKVAPKVVLKVVLKEALRGCGLKLIHREQTFVTVFGGGLRPLDPCSF